MDHSLRLMRSKQQVFSYSVKLQRNIKKQINDALAYCIRFEEVYTRLSTLANINE